MKRVWQIFGVLVVLVVVLSLPRYVRHHRARGLALPVVEQLGGEIGSITAPFGGSEYCVTFPRRTLTRGDIDRLAVLNDLARAGNSVMLILDDNNVAAADHAYLVQALSEVYVTAEP